MVDSRTMPALLNEPLRDEPSWPAVGVGKAPVVFLCDTSSALERQLLEAWVARHRPEDGTDAKLANNLEFFVKLTPPDRWPRETPTLGSVLDVLQKRIEEIPGIEVNFSQPIRDNVNESISGQQGQIAVKLYGEDLTALQAQAEKMKSVISRVPGVADLALVKSASVLQVRVKPNRVALARYGMDLGEFQHVFQTALGGRPVADYWEGERKFDVVLRLPPADRDDVEKIRSLRVPVDGGLTIPLSALADVETGVGRASINRENGRRYIGIRMNVRGRDMGGFVNEARDRVEREAPLGKGMAIEGGGEFENKERAMARLSKMTGTIPTSTIRRPGAAASRSRSSDAI